MKNEWPRQFQFRGGEWRKSECNRLALFDLTILSGCICGYITSSDVTPLFP